MPIETLSMVENACVCQGRSPAAPPLSPVQNGAQKPRILALRLQIAGESPVTLKKMRVPRGCSLMCLVELVWTRHSSCIALATAPLSPVGLGVQALLSLHLGHSLAFSRRHPSLIHSVSLALSPSFPCTLWSNLLPNRYWPV